MLPYQANLKHAGHSQQYIELTDKALRASVLIGLSNGVFGLSSLVKCTAVSLTIRLSVASICAGS